jgi:hypothetical protein
MDYLSSQTFVRMVLEVTTAATTAGYAVSRVTSHRLSATSSAVVLIGAAAFATLLVSVYSFFVALSDTASGLVTKDGTERPSPNVDVLSAGRLWGRVALFGVTGAAWGAGLTFLALAALNRREQHFVGLFVGVFAAAGVASITAGIASTALGIRFALDVPKAAKVRSARRRAWRDLALPMSVLFALFVGAFTVLLFHDYHTGAAFTKHVLTEKEILADLPLQVIGAVAIGNFALGRAGRAEATLGLVSFDDPERQTTRSVFGVQALVYVALVVAVAGGALARFVLPAYPTLVDGGIGYTRGAANATVTKR